MSEDWPKKWLLWLWIIVFVIAAVWSLILGDTGNAAVWIIFAILLIICHRLSHGQKNLIKRSQAYAIWKVVAVLVVVSILVIYADFKASFNLCYIITIIPLAIFTSLFSEEGFLTEKFRDNLTDFFVISFFVVIFLGASLMFHDQWQYRESHSRLPWGDYEF